MRRVFWKQLVSAVGALMIGVSGAAAQMGMGGMGGAVVSPVISSPTTPAAVESAPRSGDPALHAVTEEFHVLRSSQHTPAEGKTGTGGPQQTAGSGTNTHEDRHLERHGYLALRTTRIHPHPDLRHATDRYEAIDVSTSAAAASIRQALQRPLAEALDVADEPLRSVIDRLGSLTGVTFVPDMRALNEAGLDLDELTVTARIPPVSLRSALRLLLADVDLTYLVRDEVLVVTTRKSAEEALVVRIYPVPGQVVSPPLIGLIRSTVASTTWDTVGGPGSIQPSLETNALVIAQTQEVHEDIVDLLQGILDGDLAPAAGAATIDPEAIPTRLHAVRDERLLQELAQKLVPLCNAALGTAGDPDARATAIGGQLMVQSRKRSFHAYAAETIRAITGVDVTTPEYHGVSGSMTTNPVGPWWMGTGPSAGGMGGMGGGLGICWVAREVYGAADPRWLLFRHWLVGDAPPWLRSLYAKHGESFAHWLRFRPTAKLAIRLLMNAVVAAEHGPPPGIRPAVASPPPGRE